MKTIDKHQNNVIDDLLVSLPLTLTDVTHCSGVYIVDFEQVNVGWLIRLILSLYRNEPMNGDC